ncbi:STY1053 family phage-associated protein [Acinetobacter pittii]|uniref:STY1053 family phage-associated protein n=1 Tax=Acinetobacter pittii TaxID=48296 RepID=UPI002952E731|nr:hypothetical protein [Acinetobacter pittii]MDV7705013.1 hypothetical protein [Acinetobacter pittii]MDV7760377.1 hypothetical protein [Acinetobacter pittii]
MSELVQILLSKQLTVNLGRDDQGEAKTVVLQAGLQQVEKEIAEHWFVAAHSQEIPAHSAYTNELEELLEQKDQEIAAMQIQIDEAEKQHLKHGEDIKAKDKEISDLKIQSAKDLQTQASESKDALDQAQKVIKDRDAEITKLKADLAKATSAKSKEPQKET